MGARFSLRGLKEQCKYLEDAVRSERIVPDEALAVGRPGASKNPGKGTSAWVKWYGTLRAFHDRGAQRVAGGSDTADAMARAALGRKPVTVEGAPGEDGAPRRWHVHPKGYDAHEYIHERDLLLAWLNGWSHRLHGSALDARHELAAQVALERAYQNALLCWIVTTPGAWLPFDPFVDPRPEVPAEYRTLDELELLRIIQAFVHVNAGRGAALTQVIAPPKETGAPGHRGWSIFYATLGTELQVPPATLMRDYTLPELIAQRYLSAGAEREAYEQAKRTHDAGDTGDDGSDIEGAD